MTFSAFRSDSSQGSVLTSALMRRWDLPLMALVLAAGLAIRLFGITFGLPYVYYPDEALLVNHAVGFGMGDLNPHSFVYPSLYMYLLFVIYGTSFVIGRIMGVFASTDDFVRLFFNDVTLFYLPGRLIAALAGLLSIAVVYRLGRQGYAAQAGIVGAAFLGFSAQHVEFSHYLKTHVPAGFLVICALTCAWSIYQGKDGLRHYMLAGVLSGLAASTIYHAGFVLFSVIVAHSLRWYDSSQNRSMLGLLSIKPVVAAVASFAAFTLGTPFALLDWRTFVSDLTSSAALYASGDIWRRGALYTFTSLVTGIGAPLGYVALAGLVYAVIRHRAIDLILVSQPLFVGGFLMLFPTKERHHMLVTFPAVSLLAGSMITDLVKWTVRRPVLQPAALAATTLVLVYGPAAHAYDNARKLNLPDTRTVAKEWIERHVDPGSRIVMDSGKYYLGALGPPLRLSPRTLQRFVDRAASLGNKTLAQRDGARRVGYPGEAVYFENQLRTNHDDAGYDVFQILHDGASPRADVLTPEQYMAEGVQYAVVSGSGRAGYDPGTDTAARWPDKAKAYRTFYDWLEKHATLLKEFTPSDKMVGPTLRIYRLPAS